MFMKQVVQKRNCLYCFTQTHFICKNTTIPPKKKNKNTQTKKNEEEGDEERGREWTRRHYYLEYRNYLYKFKIL